MTARPSSSAAQCVAGSGGPVEAEAMAVDLDEAPTDHVEHLAQLGGTAGTTTWGP
jgi:hypothetical protein